MLGTCKIIEQSLFDFSHTIRKIHQWSVLFGTGKRHKIEMVCTDCSCLPKVACLGVFKPLFFILLCT